MMKHGRYLSQNNFAVLFYGKYFGIVYLKNLYSYSDITSKHVQKLDEVKSA